MKRPAGAAVLLLLLLLGVLLVAAQPAAAHADLIRTDPPQNQRVDDPPSRFVFSYTEPVEPRQVDIRVLDEDDNDRVESISVSDSGTRIEVEVGELEEGLYTVHWEVISTVDGHKTADVYLVAVQMDIPEGTELPTRPDVADIRFWETVARALAYAGASLAAGIPAYLLYRFRFIPVKGWLHEPISVRTTREQTLMRTAGWGALVSAGAVTALIIGLAVRIDDGLVEAITTTSGRMLAIRAALLLAGGALAFQTVRSAHRAPWTGATLVVVLAALLVTSLSAHAAATTTGIKALNVGMDFLHQAAAAAWISGVVALIITLPRAQDARTAGILVRDFSPFALGAVALLVITGVYASLLHIGDPRQMSAPSSGWELMLLVKILLLLPLIALGAWNRYRLQPRLLAGADNPALPRIRRSVVLEVVLMAIVLVATGALTHATPPRDVDDESDAELPGQVAEFVTEDGDTLRAGVTPQPVTVGIQNVTVLMEPADTVPNNAGVFLTLHGPDGGETGPVRLARIDEQPRWYVRDTLFNQQGSWHVIVLVQGEDYHEEFDFFVTVES